jgi:hypothetical protein
MLKIQCDSCNKLQVTNNLDKPQFWTRVTVSTPSDALSFDLCTDCAKKPMTFGLINFGAGEVTDKW